MMDDSTEAGSLVSTVLANFALTRGNPKPDYRLFICPFTYIHTYILIFRYKSTLL